MGDEWDVDSVVAIDEDIYLFNDIFNTFLVTVIHGHLRSVVKVGGDLAEWLICPKKTSRPITVLPEFGRTILPPACVDMLVSDISQVNAPLFH